MLPWKQFSAVATMRKRGKQLPYTFLPAISETCFTGYEHPMLQITGQIDLDCAVLLHNVLLVYKYILEAKAKENFPGSHYHGVFSSTLRCLTQNGTRPSGKVNKACLSRLVACPAHSIQVFPSGYISAISEHYVQIASSIIYVISACVFDHSPI